MTQSIDWRISYSPFSLAIILIEWLTWFLLIRYINSSQKTQTTSYELPNRSSGPVNRLPATNGVGKQEAAPIKDSRSVGKGIEPRKWFRLRKHPLFRARTAVTTRAAGCPRRQ